MTTRTPKHGFSRAWRLTSIRLPRIAPASLVSALLLTAAAWCTAQEVMIQSLSRNGVLSWTNASLSVTCRVEWATSVDGPWHASWDTLTGIVITNHVTEASVPMFYRVISSSPPAVAWLTNVTAAAALTLVTNLSSNASFVILDVRTATEYASGHIKNALNIDFYSAAFQTNVGQLDREKTYLVYCASGNRSRQAVQVMQTLGFLRIYNMTQGFSTFAALSGAGPYLEP